MCSETVFNVVAANRHAVAASKRVCFIPVQTSSDRVAGMVAASFSLYERRIFQSVSENTSLKSSSPKCTILSRLTVGPCSGASGNSTAPTCRETRSPSLNTDFHKTLLLPMLEFYKRCRSDPGDHQSVCRTL